MKTRFSLELTLDEPERLRLYQVFQYLVESGTEGALVSHELADYICAGETEDGRPEQRFAELIGTEPPGIDIIGAGKDSVRLFDSDGEPNLRVLCQIIANVVPPVLPLEFSFALVDEAKHRFSGGLVVMTVTSAEIQTIDSMLARRGGQRLH
ncbi:MAG: hypothetical protein H0X36_12040 [Sphingomonadaceae bacterium]|nr:hypothetical protein [Sphingomonadaceae bacterium]